MKNVTTHTDVFFSCVVPTNGRENLLMKLLVSLRKADVVGGVPLEIIIIDDTKYPGNLTIKKICIEHDATYLEGSSSVREKRNLGIANARGEFVFFIDSDCEASVSLFKEHYSTILNSNHSACIGVTRFVGKQSFIWKVISNSKFLESFNFPVILKERVKSAPWGPTTNLSVRKRVLDEIGGFETNLPFKLGADDADLGLRINSSGYTIGMNEKAIVYHSNETWNSWLRIIKRVFRWGRMDYYLFYQRHVKNTFFTLPRPIIFFYFFLFFLTPIGCLFSSLFLGLSLLWLFLFFLAFSIIKKKHWRLGEPLGVLVISEMLNFLFDFGCSIESIKHGSFLVAYREPIDDPRNIWHKKIHEIWASFLSLLVLTFSFILWLVFR